jgi:hypothetical protein
LSGSLVPYDTNMTALLVRVFRVPEGADRNRERFVPDVSKNIRERIMKDWCGLKVVSTVDDKHGNCLDPGLPCGCDSVAPSQTGQRRFGLRQTVPRCQ